MVLDRALPRRRARRSGREGGRQPISRGGRL